MTTTILERRGLARLAVLSLPVAAVILLPSGAIAASGSGSTIRATVGGDGAVKSVKVYAPNGSASSFNGTLPLKLSISRTVSGSTSTYTYHVENTYSKTQTISYTDTAGKTHSASADLQLPLVAQLGIQLPKSFSNVSTPNGVVESDPDGVNRLLFNMVLFSPIGSPVQDVTFTATGKGTPTAELSAATVNPTTTAGLSSSAQDANASSQQDDFWTSYATGGNGGLTQLADGVGKMIAGLTSLAPGAHKLADGLKTAGAGAVLLDNGTKSAFGGAELLRDGANKASSGGQQLTTGAKAAYDGSKKLATGSQAAAAGATALSTGLGQINTGTVALDGGLGQISGGLGQLAAPAGLPAAVTGLQQIQGFMSQVIAGIGSTSDAPTASLLGGLNAINLGLQGSQASLATLDAGLVCAVATINAVSSGFAGGAPATGCSALPPLVPADATSQLVLGGLATQLSAAQAGVHASVTTGLPTVIGGVQAVIHGLTHTPSAGPPADPGGVKEVLTALNGSAGLGKVVTGLQAAVTGVDQLNAGAAAALTGADQLAAGTGSALTGSQQLAAGVGAISTGASALSAGLGKISGGLDQLSPGLVKIANGLGSLTTGLGKLSAGQHQVATGLPAAVSGSGQIADGADQLLAGATAVKGGILAVQSGATAPLMQQLTEGSQNAKKQVAILTAAGALASEAPGGAGSTYVLSQSPHGFRLAASSSSTGGSHAVRNVGIGLGGLAVLVIAITAGFFIGRRSSISA